MFNFRKNTTLWALGFLLISVTCILFFYINKNPGECNRDDFNFLNHQIICAEKLTVDKKNYVEFKAKLIEYIEKEKAKGNITLASVYFRDLEYGPTFGVNEYETFSPASLLKVPMMITYLAHEEENPGFINTKVYYEGRFATSMFQSIPPKDSIKEGVQYTLLEIIEYMIRYSDNKAYYLLIDYLNKISFDSQLLRDTFIDLGIVDPRDKNENTINVKSYASIFSQLFNSTYFSNKETSELALKLLSEVDYSDGLKAGLPKDIKVAHKFGERFDSDTGIKQLHDCGVVYFPENPYLLCVMTRGEEMDKLAEFISEVSKRVYQEFNSRVLIK